MYAILQNYYGRFPIYIQMVIKITKKLKLLLSNIIESM